MFASVRVTGVFAFQEGRCYMAQTGRKQGQSIAQLAVDIKQAAYLFGIGECTESELARRFKRSERTIHRWKQSPIWTAQIALLQEEG